MISYPNIPLPKTDFSGTVAVSGVRTDLTNGYVEQDSRYSTRLKTYSASWTFTTEEFTLFEEWFSETLSGGVLIFGMPGVDDGDVNVQPFRFSGGTYNSTLDGGRFYSVTASLESLLPGNAAANRVPPVPSWLRLAIDPIIDQQLTLSHRNALLTSRPDLASIRTLRIYPPTDPTQYIYFGIKNLGEGDTLITSADVAPLLPEAVFPFPNLPQVEAGFADSGERRVARLMMDGGRARQWVQWDTTRKAYSVSWVFDILQLKTFQDFYFATLKNGSRKFTMSLPVDGLFAPVVVRFIGGTYKESYLEGGFWRISAQLERETEQTVVPAEWRPYGLYYSPTVNVTANRKVLSGDAGKFFVVNPDLGQTINLHIYDLEIEFGLLIKGLGNVLITRGPFVVDLVAGDTGVGEYAKLGFELRSTELDIGTIPGDTGVGEYAKLGFSLISTVKDIGTIPGDTGVGEYAKLGFEILTVLEDLGTLSGDSGSGEFLKLGFELV